MASPGAVPLAQGDYILTGLDTDEECTATLAKGGRATPLGVGLEDVAAMVPELEDMGISGSGWYRTSDFIENLSARSNPELCEAFKALGRVTGHRHYAMSEAVTDEVSPQVQVETHLFQTPEAAAAYVAWRPGSTPSGCPDCGELKLDSGPTVEALPSIAPDAVLVRASSQGMDSYWILMHSGSIAGEGLIVAPGGQEPVVDPASLAQALKDRISSVTKDSDPFDVTQMMAAPLLLEDLGDRFTGLVPDGCCFASRDNASYIDNALDAAEAAGDVTQYGRTVSYHAMYGPDIEHEKFDGPRVGTGVTLYESADQAAAALEDTLQDLLAGVPGASEPGQQFDVPGIPGAVGVAWQGLPDPDIGQFNTRVLLTHGPTVGSVTIRELDTQTFSKADDRTDAIRIARAFATHLAEALGPEG